MAKRTKILLGQLVKRGDCLYATTVARQIKNDYPGCHLTWAISSMCRSIIENNPDVDEIWEIHQTDSDSAVDSWNAFESEVHKRKDRGEYDEVFLTQVYPNNFQNYDGTSRSSIFRAYPRPLTFPIQPIVRLSQDEINNVVSFVAKNGISHEDYVILFECSSTSGQSFVTPEFALQTAELVADRVNVKIILSSNVSVATNNPLIVDGSTLGFKENAELTKYCSLLVGCSSGISWLATSDWAKPLPKIQLLNKHSRMFASMINDARYFGLPIDQIIEMTDCSPAQLAECLVFAINNGFSQAKDRYHREVGIRFDYFLLQLYSKLSTKDDLPIIFGAIDAAYDRFKFSSEAIDELEKMIKRVFLPYISLRFPDAFASLESNMSSCNRFAFAGGLTYKGPFNLLSFLLASIAGSNSSTARILLKDIIKFWLNIQPK